MSAESEARPAAPALGDAYTVERELGGGGMSRVYVAREHALDRLVVVKVLALDVAESLSAARFAREIRLAAALQEPHIVPVHSAGVTADGVPYYTMPFVRGESLRGRMEQGRLSVEECVAILRDIARALAYAHEQGVVHRDIKPENILLSSGTAMVTDFGIAKAISAARDDRQTTLTSLGMSVGTPAYMSPEQAAGDTAIDARTDIYAWGVIAWEMLSGRHPFADRSTAQRLIAAHISEPAPPLTAAPAQLARLVMRCLEKNPDARPASASDLIAELNALPSLGAIASERRVKHGTGRRVALSAAALLVVVGLAWWLGRRAPAGSPTSARSIGIATFASLSGDPRDAYFSEGMTQEIADALGRIPGLRVATHRPAPGSPTMDARTLSRALNVDLLLQGTLQRDGARVRIAAQLIDGKNGFQVWTNRFDRQSSDLFALQDDIARAVATELRIALAPAQADTLVRVTTKDSAAHDLYLQARYLFDHRGRENLYRSIDLYKRAIARDPRFAQAWAGMALSYAVITSWDDVDVDAMLEKAEAAAHNALAIDSTTSDAWAAIAESKRARWHSAEAFAAFERALALDPNNFTAHQWYGEGLAHVGRFADGLAQIHAAQRLAPLNLPVNTQEGRIELQARHLDKARQALLHVLEIDSTYMTAHTLLGGVYLQEGQTNKAIEQFKLAIRFTGSHSTLDQAFLGYAYAVAGRTDSARVALEDILAAQRRGIPVMHGGLALIYSALGDRERAIAHLDTAVSRYDAIIEMHNHEAVFDPLRQDPRGAAILARAER